MSAAYKPLISIVITCYNLARLNDAYKLLDGIKAQTYDKLEIILVIEGSQQLYEKIASYSQQIKLLNTRVVLNKTVSGASASRNIGIKLAKGEIIAFLDDDAIPFNDWAEKAVNTYANYDVIGITGPAIPLWEDANDAWFPKELHWIISCTTWFNCNEITNVRHAWLQNASFKKEAFDTAGYLDTNIGPHDNAEGFKSNEFRNTTIADDLEISLRIKEKTGKSIVYNPQVRVWHKAEKRRMTLGYIKKWSYWTGASKKTLKRLYPDQKQNILGPESQLLKRIITHLIPDIIKTVFTHPVIGFRKLRVMVTALFYVTLGYLLPRRK